MSDYVIDITIYSGKFSLLTFFSEYGKYCG